MVVELNSEQHKEIALQQLNNIQHITGFTASNIQTKLPRMIIKNNQLEFIPDKTNLLTSNTNDKIKVITVLKNDSKKTSSIIIEVSQNIRKILIKGSRVKLGMCVYPSFDNLN